MKTTEGLRTAPVSKENISNLYFSNTTTDYVYKAKIDIYGNYFGGILILKKVGAKNHRVVFTTEFGSKVFDFLYEDDTFTKNFIIEDLDKKYIVNTLQKDFKVLITEKAKVLSQFDSQEGEIYQTASNSGFNFYFVNKQKDLLEKVVNTSKRKEKVYFVFTSEEKDLAEKINIKHTNIKLEMNLEYFKKD